MSKKHFGRIHFIIFSLAIACVCSCGTTRTLKPLGKGNSQIHLSAGGPLITVGVPIPAPYTVVGYDYGLTDKINVAANTEMPMASITETSPYR